MQVAGEYALKETSLRSLGLTGGRAVIRYVLQFFQNIILSLGVKGINIWRLSLLGKDSTDIDKYIYYIKSDNDKVEDNLLLKNHNKLQR